MQQKVKMLVRLLKPRSKRVVALVFVFYVLASVVIPISRAGAQALDPCISDALKKDTVWFVGCGGSANCGPGIGGGTTSGLVWPFATKAQSQYTPDPPYRVDEGWDIQDKAGAPVYAIAPGKIHVLTPNPNGFGNDYPTQELDSSIGGPTTWIYYGHVHALPSVIDQHVSAGQQIATANKTNPDNSSAAPPGWLEIGFAKPGTDAPVAGGYEGVPTQAGQQMKNLLINAQPGAGGGGSGVGCSCSANLVGADNEEQIWNYLIGQGLSPIAVAGLMGNFQTETAGTWDPRINNGSPPIYSDFPRSNTIAYGIAQWLGGRQDALVQKARSAGVIAGSLGLQLDFAWGELTGDYKSSVLEPLKDPNLTIQQAAEIVFRSYEAPGDSSLPARQANATAIWQKYNGRATGSGGSCVGGTCISNIGTATGTAAILCEAQKYDGIFYQKGGGHGYAASRQACPESAVASAAATSSPGSPGPCATDCSGLVAVAIDAVYGKSYEWTVNGSGVMEGGGAEFWKLIPIDQVKAGDIVTRTDHVDIVDHIVGSTVYTFGSHAPGVKTGPDTTDKSYWTGAYHWAGGG